MAIKDRTHDISLIGHHVKDVQAFVDTVNRAVSAAFPRASRSRYTDVYVLLISWEDDDLGVRSEIAELDAVFRDVYRYKTAEWQIPSAKSHNALVRRIMQSLEEFESGDKLFIVYYGGHGYMNDDRQCVWLSNQQPEAATLQWSSIQTMLEEADCDVLILLDCCAAASSAGGSSNTITELIAACGFESYAPGVGEHSFTRSLIEELKYYGQRPDLISTAFLHNKVLARTKKSWNPRYAVDGTHERRRTPIHVHLADKSMQRCINLSPLPPVLTHQVPPLPELPGTTPSSSTEESTKESDNSGIDSTSQSSLSEVWPDPQHDSPKVLISIALEEGQPLSAAEWFDWLLSFPAKAKCIHLESIYKSDSTLMLLSLPVAVWDMLPRDPAISFISFVKSQNLLFPKNRPKGLAIALKRILDREIRISRKMARHRDIESTRTSFPKTESAPSTTGWELGEIRHAIDSLSQPSTARTHIPTEADFSPPIDLLGLSHVHQPEHGDDNHWTHTLVSSEPENFKSGQSIQNSSPSKPIVPESSEHPHNRREPPSEPNKSSRLGKFLPQRWKRES